MNSALALLEWTAAAAAAWFAVEASDTGSTLTILTAAMCAIIAGLVRQLAIRGMLAQERDALHARLRLAVVPRGGAR